MRIELTGDANWNRLFGPGSERAWAKAAHEAMRGAAVEAVRVVKDNFAKGGRPKWRRYSASYAKLKAAGKAAPGKQVSFSTSPDLVLTGALRLAAVNVPEIKISGNAARAEIQPTGGIRLYKQPVSAYADHVNKRRPYYVIPAKESKRIGDAYARGILRGLFGQGGINMASELTGL